MKSFLVLWLFLAFCMAKVYAQDFQFSQPFTSAVYLNPAFTGNGILVCKDVQRWADVSNFKGTLQLRNQWNGTFHGGFAGLEHTTKKNLWSFGGHYVYNRLNTIQLANNYLGLTTSVNVAQDDEWIVKFGYQLGIGNRVLTNRNFNFADEFNGSGFDFDGTAENPAAGNSKFYVDLASFGLLLQHKALFLGLSGHHLLQPDQSLWNGEDKLKRKFSAQGGGVIDFTRAKTTRQTLPSGFRMYIVSTFKAQGGSRQWDGGSYLEYATPVNDHYYLLHIGGWYRGIPLLKAPDKNPQQDALVAILGIQRNMVRLLYSYDIPLSSARSFGTSQEISIVAQITNHKCRSNRPYGPIPCKPKTKYKKKSRIVWGS